MRRYPFSTGARWLVLALLLAASQCLDDGSAVTVDIETEPLPFEHVMSGQNATLPDTTELVVKDSDQWSSVSNTLISGRAPETPDFDQYMVLLAALPVESGGYDVRFRSVEIAGDRLIASYAIGIPADDCITTMGTTVPYEAVAVRKVDLPVAFERTQELIRCTFR